MKRIFLILFFLVNLGFVQAQNESNLSVSPNPFYSSTSINFQLAENDTVTLKVLNIYGYLVKEYYNNAFLPIGSYSLNLSGDNLNDGFYFVSLKIGANNTITKKLVKDVRVVGIWEQNSVNKNFVLNPNPSNAIITLPIEGIKNIIVTDLNGRILKRETTSKKEISISDLASGEYIFTILSEKQKIITVQKIIKVE